ncbi:MAG TPA: DUF1073 domain-containing protein [candidate division Zixibacteria bacterium]|nr:DUF1073 domain-containing protein [candidate division Zixibacteria bacterium]
MPARKKKAAPEKKLTANQADDYLRALSAIAVRASIANRLGKSFSDDRDIYAALGYTKSPSFNDYMARYHRQDIAKAVINKPVEHCWRMPPTITESDEEETEFEKKWVELVESRHIYHKLIRVDKLASIGTYAVLLIGADDGLEFDQELSSAKRLLYLTPYTSQNASISAYETDTNSERFGLPKEYSINVRIGTGSSSRSVKVHHSRVIHVAEDLLEDNVEGTPRLRCVLNRLQDLELIVGGSAEMFWRGAFPGYGFKVDEGHTIGPQDLEDLQDEIEEYMHGLKRYIRLRGMSVEDLAMQVADPTGHANIIIDLISCATGIPKRILLGSERGELASSQDEKNWMDTVDSRRKQHCEPTILRPLIDRLIKAQILPEPSEGYSVEWPDLMTPSDKEVAEVGASRSKAVKDYMESGADSILPPEIFYEKVMGFSKEEIDQIQMILESIDRELQESEPELEPEIEVTGVEDI